MGGVPFNDAYRYMDWLLTVPLLLIEILLVMRLESSTFNCKAWVLGVGSALMIVSGYYGELVVTGDLTPRWICWLASMAFFLYIVYELLVGLAAATASEADDKIAGQIKLAQLWQSNWATVFPTSSPSVELDWSSTKSHMANPPRRGFWRRATVRVELQFIGDVSSTR